MNDHKHDHDHDGLQRAKRARLDPVREAMTRLRNLQRSDPDSPFAQRAAALIEEWQADLRERKGEEYAALKAARAEQEKQQALLIDALARHYGKLPSEIEALPPAELESAIRAWSAAMEDADRG